LAPGPLPRYAPPSPGAPEMGKQGRSNPASERQRYTTADPLRRETGSSGASRPLRASARLTFDGRLDEACEPRLLLARRRAAPGVELAAHEPGMIGQFHHFDELLAFGQAGNPQPSVFEMRQVMIVHFVTMAMPLADDVSAINLACAAVGFEHGC